MMMCWPGPCRRFSKKKGGVCVYVRVRVQGGCGNVRTTTTTTTGRASFFTNDEHMRALRWWNTTRSTYEVTTLRQLLKKYVSVGMRCSFCCAIISHAYTCIVCVLHTRVCRQTLYAYKTHMYNTHTYTHTHNFSGRTYINPNACSMSTLECIIYK